MMHDSLTFETFSLALKKNIEGLFEENANIFYLKNVILQKTNHIVNFFTG